MVNLMSNIASLHGMTDVVNAASQVFNRLSSNQEFTPPPSVAHNNKPHIAGIGKAPKNKTKTKSKPYDRTVSRSASRKASARSASRKSDRHISLRGARVTSVANDPWTTEVAGTQLLLDDIEDVSIEDIEPHQDEAEAASVANVCEGSTSSHSISVVVRPADAAPAPPATTSQPTVGPSSASTTTITSASAPDLFIRIPGHLQKPSFPPLVHLCIDDEMIPTDYVRHHLDPHLSKVLDVSAMYRPLSYAESPTSPAVLLNDDGLTHSMAFGVPVIVRGEDKRGQVADYVAGYEPDLLLAIRSRSSNKFALRPVKHIVYAARCSLFPSLPSKPLSMRFVHPEHSDTVSESDEDSDDDSERDDHSDDGSSIQGIVVERSRPASALSYLSTRTDDSAATRDTAASDLSTVSSTDAASDVASFDTGVYTHLPILAIELPAPESFEILHNQLHMPQGTWEPVLLGLHSSQATTPAVAIAALDTLSTREINMRLTRLHGVWANMCALGVDEDRMWVQVNRAYKILLDTLRRRAHRS